MAAVALVVLAAGALCVAVLAGDSDVRDEVALHRCEPVREDVAPLAAVFPQLGAVEAGAWCVMARGTPDTARVTVPGPHDWAYYGVVRLDAGAAEAWGPWKPSFGPGVEGLPGGLRGLVPASGVWAHNGVGVYLERTSGTVVLDGVSAP